MEIGDGHQGQADQEPDPDAAQEQGADGGGSHDAVDDHGDGRRDDDADGPGRGLQGRGEPHVVAPLLHLGDHQGSDGRRVRRGGAGDPGEEHGGQDRDVGEAPVNEPDQGAGEIDDPAADAAGFHQGSGQHEEGDGQELKRVVGGEHLLDRHGQFHVEKKHHGGRRRDAHREGDGHPQQHEADENREDRVFHGFPSPGSGSIRTRVWKMMIPAETGRTR